MTNYLVELDRRGWDLESFLAEHPEVSAALGELLRTADRVRRASPPAPSEAFRLRSRRRLAVAMARPAPRRRWYRIGSHWRDYRPLVAPVAAGLLIVLGLGGVWSASASALPSSPLYSAKLVMEQAALVTAITPDRRAVVHLAIAQERLREAAIEQERGDLTVAQELIQGSDAEVARAQDVLQASSPPTAVATAVASTVAEVNDERRQVAMRVGARPTAARFTKVLDQQAVAATAEPHGTAVVAAEPVRGSDSAASGTGGSHDSEVSGSPGDGSSRLRGHSNNAGATGDGGTENWTAAKIVLTPTPTPETKSGASAVQPADSLLQTLLIQAKAGDPASQETADQYVAAVRRTNLATSSGRATLAAHRAALKQAIALAPSATRPVLESVLQDLRGLADPEGQNHAGPTGTPAPTTDRSESRDYALSSRHGRPRADDPSSVLTPSSGRPSGAAVKEKPTTAHRRHPGRGSNR